MQITAIQARFFDTITNSKKSKPVTKDIPTSDKYTKSIYEKGSSVYFTGRENLVNKFVYEKLLKKHIRYAMEPGLPRAVENYFASLGISANFSKSSPKANGVVAYGAFHTNEIFRRLGLAMPPKLDMEQMVGENSSAIAACYYYPSPYKGYPIRTITFNTLYNWENHMENSIVDDPFHSSRHFLQTFIHEYVHNIHFHKLYAKYGSPAPDPHYVFNPNVGNLMEKLNTQLYDKNGNPVQNPYITQNVRNIMKESSGYGSTLLPELFAEEISGAICKALNYNTLELKYNPLPVKTNQRMDNLLYEVWEGLIDDGKGLI